MPIAPFKYNEGDIIKTKTGSLQITSLYREKKEYKRGVHYEKMYAYKCLVCGYNGSKTEGSMKRGSGCLVCLGQKCEKGINDLWTTDKEVAELLWNPEEGYEHTRMGKFYTDWRCPVCGKRIENINIAQVTVERHVSCPICSDSNSYPNKFMFNLLEELGVDFQREYSPEWVGKKRYDFVIKDKKIIIEMDGGLGHGRRQYGKNKGISPEKSLKTDRQKDKAATDHGYSVIRIDCRYGRNNRFEIVRNNICNSQLAKIFDLSKIDFKRIDSLSWKQNFVIACELYDNSQLTVIEIANKMKQDRDTIRDYLKKGAEIGICSYSIGDRRLPKTYYESRQRICVLQYRKNDDSLAACYDSIREASKITGINASYIVNICKGMKDYGKGYYFRYCKDCIDGRYIPEVPELYLLPINQYDKNGHYIRTYSTLIEIHELHSKYTKSINRVVRVDHAIFYKGYMWKLDDGDHKDIKPYVPFKGRAVLQINKETGEIIARFRSILEAHEETGINNIGAVLAGNRAEAGECFWEYEDEWIKRHENNQTIIGET